MCARHWLGIMYGAILVVALLYTIAPQWGEQADIWETAAAVQAISDSPSHPRNPLLDLPGNTSPRFTPYTVFWGAVDRMFDLRLFTSVALAGLLNLLLFVTGVVRVMRTIVKDDRALLWIFPIMLLGWGRGYGEANAYQAEFLFASMALVGTFTYGICFHGLAELNRFLSTGARSGLIGYIALAVLAFLSHPITALLLFVAAFAWAIVRVNWKTAALLQAVPFFVLGVSLLWPYFDYYTLLFRGSTEAWYRVRLFDDQIMKIGPVLLGIPIAVYFAMRKKHLELVIALGCSLAIYLLSWALDVQIGSRFIFYGAVFSHFCLGLFFLESGVFQRSFFAQNRFRIAVVAFLLLAVFLVGGYYRARKGAMQWQPIVAHYEKTNGDILEPWQDMDFLRANLNSNSVVMVEDTVGWRLPAVTGARLVAQAKGDPLIQDDVNLRRVDATNFFNSDLSSMERWELLTKYRCTHVLVDERHADRNHSGLTRDLDSMSDLVSARAPYRLYLVKQTGK